MIQKTDKDKTTPMPAELPPGFFIPDDEYNAGVNGGDPANGANPANGTDPEKGASPPPTITQDKMREVLTKLLDEKVGELFGKLVPEASTPSTSK